MIKFQGICDIYKYIYIRGSKRSVIAQITFSCRTFAFSDRSTVTLRSVTSDFSSAKELRSSSLQALRLATAEAVKDLDVERLRTLVLLGELVRENLQVSIKRVCVYL